MLDDFLREIAAWLSDRETQWFLVFWGSLALLAAFEIALPAFRQPAQREKRWPTNLAFGVFNMLIVPLVPVSAVAAAQWAQSHEVGLLNLLGQPWWAAALATFAIRSLAGYGLHVLMHKVPLFWRLHRVHHLDTHLDVSTTVRSHPLELLVNLFFMAGISILFGFDPWALAVYEVVDGITNAIEHANLRLPESADRSLRLLFVTPNMHCLHHSSYRPETDSNYGQLFSVWDRLFGTYSTAPRAGYDAMQIGLGEIRDERASDLWWQIKSPFVLIERASTRPADKPLAADRPLPAE